MICTHGLPDPACCTDCMYEGNLTPPPPSAEREHVDPDARAVQAVFPGHCPGCNFPILAGQRIRVTSRDRWVHEDCTL